jgi:ATP-dependent Clp protease ATP-binding subunit ClpA
MQENPEIKNIIESAVKISQGFGHEYVTTEHLLLSLIRHAPFRKCLDTFGVEVDQMDAEIEHYLVSQLNLISDTPEAQPRRTVALERIFNRANVQVMFTGRRAISTVDMYLSIMSETNSHAHYFLL